MSQKILTVVLCAIIDADKVLLLRRNKEPYQGYLSLPGGKIEFGETPEQAAIREVHEETGLEFASANINACVTEIIESAGEAEAQFTMFIAKLNYVGGNVSSGDEGALEWVSLSDLRNRNDIIETDVDIVERYILGDCQEPVHYSVERCGKQFTLKSVNGMALSCC